MYFESKAEEEKKERNVEEDLQINILMLWKKNHGTVNTFMVCQRAFCT